MVSRFLLGAGCTVLAAALLTQTGCSQRALVGPAATPVAASPTVSPSASVPAPARLSFNDHIQPILADNCYTCHGADSSSRKAGLRLDRAEYAFQPTENDVVVLVAGQPDQSPLIKRIESTNEQQRMPPPEAHKTLRPEQIALLRQWVAEGAEYEEHWAFIAPQRALPPPVSREHAAWARTPVDRFLLAPMAKAGLAPSPEADRRALIRRVSLDLTGLVPTSEDVEAFVADASPDAYERLVDRLLADPRWGEHRARYWLDYVRYADTHGLHFDNYRSIWPYRDYVIRAFNANKPFDAFVREQLAGDLLPARTFDELIATGLVRNNLTTNEGGTITEEVYINQTRDRVEAFGATFLGLTTGCAACHDHKFDPLTQREHYSLAAFLGNTVEKPWDLNISDPPPVLRLPKPESKGTAEVVLQARADLLAKLMPRRARARELAGEWLQAGNRPEPVSPECLELRLRLDEGQGDVVRNSAPFAQVTEFKAETNPLVWGENSWLWPSMRMDIFTRLRLDGLGEVEAYDAFSAGGWIMLRASPGGGVSTGTGSGSLLGRMGDPDRRGGAGWDLYQEDTQFIVNLTAEVEEPVISAADADAPEGTINPRDKQAPKPRRGLQVATRGKFPRDEWLHVFFTYDGSRKARGIRIYVNGKPVPTDVKLDRLSAKDSIQTDATMHLGRRDDYLPMRETRFQDVRFYRRALDAKEVVRLPFEDLASEIVARQPDPTQWTTDEAFVVADRFFLGSKDAETMALAQAVAGHDDALDALTRGGDATLIALEKPTPAYADVLKRGDYYARDGRIEPAVPAFLPPLPPGAPRNRLGLAEWLLEPSHPLMARVTVNRMWQEVFGRALVESTGDFGIIGDRPSHPDLLDWLAVEFRESGWDVKQFYRLLVTSAAYRQTATVTPEALARDPENRLLARGPRFRMDAEMLRDNALAVSGLLVAKQGGPSVKPYQPPGLWEEVAMPESDTSKYQPDTGESLYRRSLYTFWKRASAPASMETFDATSREVVCTKRARTNTPLQALVTMNDPQWVEAARKLAERAVKAAPAAEDRLAFLARTTLARSPAPAEATVLARSLAAFDAHYAQPTAAEDVAALLAVGESPPDPALAPAEVAAWTLVASQFLNLDEFLTK
jgi:mono/diheme cytochrome c family protein